MVIDYILVGTVGGAQMQEAAQPLMSEQEAVGFTDASFGVSNAVKRWGSDHLPVACRVSVIHPKDMNAAL